MIENAAIFWSLHQDLEIVDRKAYKTVTFLDKKKGIWIILNNYK